MAISLIVRTEQGAMTIPRVRNEPEAMAAPMSLTRWTKSARSLSSATDWPVSC